jgi:hypothetical protein
MRRTHSAAPARAPTFSSSSNRSALATSISCRSSLHHGSPYRSPVA